MELTDLEYLIEYFEKLQQEALVARLRGRSEPEGSYAEKSLAVINRRLSTLRKLKRNHSKVSSKVNDIEQIRSRLKIAGKMLVEKISHPEADQSFIEKHVNPNYWMDLYMKKIRDYQKELSLFSDQWSPKVIGQLNGQAVKLAKLEGEFVWHDHADEDELFLVIKGVLKIEFRDGIRTIHPGEMIIVPRGVEHKPIAEEEVHVILFEPMETKHTGDVEHELTQKEIQFL